MARPGLPRYPLRRYKTLLKLWRRQTDLPEPAAGPAMAGRLRGAAFQVATTAWADRLDLATGTRRIMIGDGLRTQASHDAWTDIGGHVHPAEPAGASVLLSLLESELGANEEDAQIAALDAFFGHVRGQNHMSMPDYLSMRRLVYDEAEQTAGLSMNSEAKSAKSFMLLRISGDLNRFGSRETRSLRRPPSQPWPDSTTSSLSLPSSPSGATPSFGVRTLGRTPTGQRTGGGKQASTRMASGGRTQSPRSRPTTTASRGPTPRACRSPATAATTRQRRTTARARAKASSRRARASPSPRRASPTAATAAAASSTAGPIAPCPRLRRPGPRTAVSPARRPGYHALDLSLIHISEPTRLALI
eukprot:14997557-Alexandrium_andersonii.AAC.1